MEEVRYKTITSVSLACLIRKWSGAQKPSSQVLFDSSNSLRQGMFNEAYPELILPSHNKSVMNYEPAEKLVSNQDRKACESRPGLAEMMGLEVGTNRLVHTMFQLSKIKWLCLIICPPFATMSF